MQITIENITELMQIIIENITELDKKSTVDFASKQFDSLNAQFR